MKKVIEGKLYDTETAKCVGEWDNGYYGNDFNQCSESLYRKKTGEFFLYGEGGPMSRYAVSIGNNTSGGAKIIPMSYNEAQEWAESHLSGDDYIEIFGEPGEDEGKEALHIYINKSTIAKIKKEAGIKNITVSEYIEKLVNG